jgi:PKD repeat protein
MQQLLRTFLLLSAAVICMAAFAQPLPPYGVIVYGTVVGCAPNSTVTIVSGDPATLPQVSIAVPVGPNCNFDAELLMDSPTGTLTASTACNGAIQSMTVTYNIGILDSTMVFVTLNCGSNTGPDCTGVVGGTDLPGTPCTTPAGVQGTWNANCQCDLANNSCFACLQITEQAPFTAVFTSCSSGGVGPYTYTWQFGDGDVGSGDGIAHTYAAPGTYSVCLDIADANGCTNYNCDSVVVDANGAINPIPNYFDCLQIPNGPNVPGTPCSTPIGAAGVWGPNCDCVLNTTADCEGVPNGPAQPGTTCATVVGGLVYTGTWTNSCYCDTASVTFDCLQIPNGPNVPGSPCYLTNTGTEGTWSNACVCVASNPDTCQAGFWVMQAYTNGDSLNNPNGGGVEPIPFELWIWNLSSGGTGNYQFVWDFGDGNSSTEAFPTHIYATSGPYTICLTITDDAGCTSTYCEDVEVDQDGILGMGTGFEVRSALTIRVIQQLPTDINEVAALEATKLWPNPVVEQFNLTLNSSRSGNLTLTIVDLNGREVRTSSASVVAGNNQLPMDVSGMEPGMYVLRLSNGTNSAAMRFVKH